MLTQSYNTSFVIRPKVRISGLLYFLLLIPHLKPALFVLDAELDMLFDVMRVISGACILCIYVFKMAKCNRMIVLVCVLFAIRFVSTLVNGLDTYALIISFVSVICMLLLTDVLLATHTKVGLNILAVSFEILAYANFLTILIWPEGIYYSDNISIGGTRRGYLLGHQTTMIYYCIVGLIALLMLSYLNPTPRNKIRAFLFFTVCTLGNVFAWSATPLIVMSFIAVLIILTHNNNIRQPSVTIGLVCMTLLFVIFVLYRLQYAFNWLLVDILRRDITFSGRTVLWDRIFQLIDQKPLLGWGTSESLIYNNINFTHTHNQILQVLFNSGFIGLVVFILIMIYFAKSVDAGGSDRFSRSISVVALPLLIIACQTEPLFTQINSLNIIFILGSRLKEIRSLASDSLLKKL